MALYYFPLVKGVTKNKNKPRQMGLRGTIYNSEVILPLTINIQFPFSILLSSLIIGLWKMEADPLDTKNTQAHYLVIIII